MDTPDKSDRQAVAVAFLQRFLADSVAVRTLGLESYQAMYPGFEDLIEREYMRLGAQSIEGPPADCAAVDDRPQALQARVAAILGK